MLVELVSVTPNRIRYRLTAEGFTTEELVVIHNRNASGPGDLRADTVAGPLKDLLSVDAFKESTVQRYLQPDRVVFGRTGDQIKRHLHIGGRETNASVTPLVVGSVALNLADYAIAGTVISSVTIKAVAASGVGSPLVGCLVGLYNVSDGYSQVDYQMFTSTSPTDYTYPLTLGAGVSQIRPTGTYIYEARIWLDGLATIGESIELYSYDLVITNTIL